MTKQKIKSRVKYLRKLYKELDEESLLTTDIITKSHLQKSANHIKVAVTFMLDTLKE